MSQKKQPTAEHDQLEEMQAALTKSEQFLEKYQKQLLIGVVIVVVAVSGFFGLQHFYLQPRQAEAQDAMFKAVFYFEKDSTRLALEGDGVALGFRQIADQYSSTEAGNLSKLYAGECLYQMGKHEEAISYLKGYSSSETMTQSGAYSKIGDCYVEMDNAKEGASYFEKASKEADNQLYSPIYLMKAAHAYEKMNDFKSALKAYQTIKDKYYMSQEAQDIDKYIVVATAKAK